MSRWDARRIGAHNEEQIGYYDHPERKRRMFPNGSRYVVRQAERLVRFAGLQPGMRVLEVGSGMGRYTFLLADRGLVMEGLDLSPDLIDRFRRFDGGRYAIPVHQADVARPPSELVGRFDAVVGFMTLHHMHDIPACMGSVAGLLVPGGRAAFLEPNPYNPLYYVQVTVTPGMTWGAEAGMLRMRPGILRHAMGAAGLTDFRHERFGFFPSFVTNAPGGGVLESALERVPLWRPLLPFQLFGAARGEGG